MPVTYPLDLTGVSPANLVTNELHSVNEAHFRDYFFIVPNFAPFYVDNFKATITIGSTTRDLVEDVDFSFALSYVTGTRVTGKAMYGAITLHNLNLNGIINLQAYQTIGGDQIADRLQVLTLLADKAYNPRTTIWDILTNVPNALPPSPHYQDYDQFFGQEEVVNALGQIRDAIIQNSSLTQDQIAQFLQLLNAGNLSTFMKRTGDNMTGPLTLYGPPITDLHAATKKYVDDNTINSDELSNYMSQYHNATYVDQALGNKVNKVGDTMTGHLTLNADPIQNLHAATKNYVDTTKSNLESQIQQVASSVQELSQNPVTKEYVDNKLAEVLAYIQSVVINRA